MPNPPGAYALDEIVSQPQFWDKCLNAIARESLTETRQPFNSASEWLFIGCGSSYYLAQAAAASWTTITGIRARAIPASELLLFPELVLAGAGHVAAVAISRSGRTSETIRAAQFLERERNIRVLAVTGAPGQPLEQSCTVTLPLLPCDEQSTVMTRSFTSMLLGMQYLAASQADNEALRKSLAKLPSVAARVMTDLNPPIRDFVSTHQFADYVCLGQGAFYGLACENALKLTEMSVSYAQSFHTMEFRHGPKSIVAPETLITFLISDQGYEAERDVLEEIKGLGGTTLTVVNHADDRVRKSSDLLVELNSDLPEVARLAAYIFAGQLTGLYTGLKKNLDPDNPRHLSRVVVLEDQPAK